ncbi:MAG: hypothetical protein WC342_00605 [Methanoregula sp.]|jgi:hypothetical protein
MQFPGTGNRFKQFLSGTEKYSHQSADGGKKDRKNPGKPEGGLSREPDPAEFLFHHAAEEFEHFIVSSESKKRKAGINNCRMVAVICTRSRENMGAICGRIFSEVGLERGRAIFCGRNPVLRADFFQKTERAARNFGFEYSVTGRGGVGIW